jgi:putative membrane protein insertion efficiency factor|tara:strand:+ start:1347 stop:1595 length:249 start_codon:yes stop_codon:yes gene_type:complete
MKLFTYILIKFILGYKFLISPLLGHSCRYFPTCSDYSVEALKEFGFFKGIYLSVKRILSCHPWNEGGFDPIKKKMKVKSNGL